MASQSVVHANWEQEFRDPDLVGDAQNVRATLPVARDLLDVADGDGMKEGVKRAYNTTTDATQTELFTDGAAARMTIPSDSTWVFQILVAARRTDVDNESAGYLLEGVIDNNAGTTAIVGAYRRTVFAEDDTDWQVVAEADDTNDALVLKVTGEAAKTIDWLGRAIVLEVTG
jgi:hypothetical protein